MNAQALHLIAAALSEPSSPSPRSAIIELGGPGPDDPSWVERMQRAQEKWRKPARPEDIDPDFVERVAVLGVSFDHRTAPREVYVSLPNPAAEAQRQRVKAALAESDLRYAQRKFSQQQSVVRRRVFVSSMNQRIGELLGSRRVRSHRAV